MSAPSGMPAHRSITVADLELVMAQHWQAAEQDWLGGWLLRASGGFTNRANSVLAVGEPGMPMDVAVLEVGDWYADRGLRPVAASPAPRPGEDGVEQLLAAAAAFDRAGWAPIPGAGAIVLTGSTRQVRDAGPSLPPGLRVELRDSPDPAWIAQYHYRGQPVPGHGVRLLTSAPEQVFAAVRTGDGDGDGVVAVARGSLAEGWAGLTAMEVDPAHRRRGLARALIAAIAGWAVERGTASLQLQVGEHNEPGRHLYTAAGLEPHHPYAYLTPQLPDPAVT